MIKIIYKQNSGAHRASADQIYIQFLASSVRHVVVFVVVVNHIIVCEDLEINNIQRYNEK